MHQTKVMEIWVGLFVAIGMVALFFLAMKVSNLADLQIDDNSYRLVARFENVGSLRERAPVSMGGVRIGRVSSIRFDKDTYEAVVEMRIEPAYNTIPTDTTANILTAGLLGEQYIGLSAGGSPEFLKPGDQIELSQSAMVLEEVISRFLFNKAEGGSEKKGDANSSAEQSGAESRSAMVEETPAQAKPKDRKKEVVASPRKPNSRKDAGETAADGKPKTAHTKTSDDGHPGQKEARSAGRSGEAETQPRAKAAVR